MTESTTEEKIRLLQQKQDRGNKAARVAIEKALASGGDPIMALEALITPRRIREALLGEVESGCFVERVDEAIKNNREGQQ